MESRAFGESRCCPKLCRWVNKARRAAVATRFAPRHERAAPVSKDVDADARLIFRYFTTWHSDAAIARLKTMSWWRDE
jgi:hypothetical protein